MGVVEKLITFNNKRGGKIVTFSLIGFGLGFFVIGLLMILIMSPGIKPSRIFLLAENNLKYEETGAQAGWHLDITDPRTTILAATDMGVGNTTISFSTNQTHLIDITPRTSRTAIIQLKKDDNGLYKLSKETITIYVTCGSANTVIFANIVITPQKTTFIPQLQKQNGSGDWDDVTRVDADLFDLPPAKYRVSATFTVFGQLRQSTYDEDQIGNFGFTSTDADTSDITGIYGLLTTTLRDPINDTYRFELWVNFFEEKHYAKAEFSITIKM